jgi:hypothetical protein
VEGCAAADQQLVCALVSILTLSSAYRASYACTLNALKYVFNVRL